MEIYKHRYSLRSKGFLNASEFQRAENDFNHEGFLFKVRFATGQIGYSSLHLHPSLGDLTADAFDKKLKEQKACYIEEFHSQIIENAKIDAQNLWQEYFNDFRVTSHFTSTLPLLDAEVLGELKKSGFKRIKIKVGTTKDSFSEIIDHYQNLTGAFDFEWVFDFNATADKEILFKDLQRLKLHAYLEDPLPFHPGDWQKLISAGALLLADQVSHAQVVQSGLAIAGLVVKPTKVNMKEYLGDQNSLSLLVTTNMGEDIDILTASYWAQYIYKNHPHRFLGAGLLTDKMYQPSQNIRVAQDVFKNPERIHATLKTLGPNWGKRSFLKDLDWIEV